jgi:indoleamine 2,3-dioxygenase
MRKCTPVRELSSYGIDPVRGFVPAADPLPRLGPRYAPWERLARRIPYLLMTGRLRPAVAALPVLPIDALSTDAERERAMLVLSFLGGAYVWAEPVPATRLPAALAVPWWQVADAMGVPPVLRHSSIVLTNWRRVDRRGPVDLGNLDTALTFLGGVDEKWFYLATLGVELAGAPVLPRLVGAQNAVAFGDTARLTDELLAIEPILRSTTRALLDVERWCDPYVFYHRIRRWLAGWPEPGLVYEGVAATPHVFAGGSAAQSSLVQAFDAGLGITHQQEITTTFLRGMRAYMPRPHRRFLADLEAGPSIADHVMAYRIERPQLGDAYTACVRALTDLRAQHLGLTGRYISRFERGTGAAKGTGGTDFVRLLIQARAETAARLPD